MCTTFRPHPSSGREILVLAKSFSYLHMQAFTWCGPHFTAAQLQNTKKKDLRTHGCCVGSCCMTAAADHPCTPQTEICAYDLQSSPHTNVQHGLTYMANTQ
jgi:hypothetical protein